MLMLCQRQKHAARNLSKQTNRHTTTDKPKRDGGCSNKEDAGSHPFDEGQGWPTVRGGVACSLEGGVCCTDQGLFVSSSVCVCVCLCVCVCVSVCLHKGVQVKAFVQSRRALSAFFLPGA